MVQRCIFALTLFVFASATFGQDSGKFKLESFDYRVAVKDKGPIMIEAANMEKTVEVVDGQPKDRFLLAFSIPKQYEQLLDKTTLKLTAYGQEGNVFGMRIWHKILGTCVGEATADSVPVSLEVSPDFAKASRFSLIAGPLEIVANNGETATASANCPGCAALANETCGAGRVKNVKCGTTKDSSTCELECKP